MDEDDLQSLDDALSLSLGMDYVAPEKVDEVGSQADHDISEDADILQGGLAQRRGRYRARMAHARAHRGVARAAEQHHDEGDVHGEQKKCRKTSDNPYELVPDFASRMGTRDGERTCAMDTAWLLRRFAFRPRAKGKLFEKHRLQQRKRGPTHC